MSLEWVVWRASINSAIRRPGRRHYYQESSQPESSRHVRGTETPPSILPQPSVPPQERENSERGTGARQNFSSMSPLEIATYMRDVQSQRPIPCCDPGHLYVSAGHRDGYVDRQGRKRPGCKSPGKAPLVPQWQRFSHQAPTESELVSMFSTHKGNIGNAVLDGRIVLDVDRRTGGLSALKLLQDVHEALPETPTQRTGGGGYHYHFLWPADVPMPAAGGSLASLGYPGVEWKGPRQQVVVAPSTYPGTGAPYEWVEGAALEDVKVAPIPVWLLDLILKASGTPSSQTHKASELGGRDTPGVRHPKLTHAEIVTAFRQMYPEGGRRAGTGVPKLVGICIGKGVEEASAVRWFLGWQQTHLLPPLSDAEMEDLVRDMYRRYGRNGEGEQTQKGDLGSNGGANSRPGKAEGAAPPDASIGPRRGADNQTRGAERGQRRDAGEGRRPHRGLAHGHQFLVKLSSAVMAADYVAPDGASITQEEAIVLTRRAIAEMRNDLLFSLRRQSQNRLPDSTPDSDMRKAILLADRRFILSKDELYDKLAFAEGPDAKILERLEHCLWDGAMTCWEHGDQFETRCMCRLFCHYACIHQTTLKIRQLALPDIPKERGCYLAVRIRWESPVYTDHDPVTGHDVTVTNVDADRKDFQHLVRNLGQRKNMGGTFLAQSMGVLLARPNIIIEGRVLFRVEGTDRSRFDAAMAWLCNRLGAPPAGERSYQEGESVVVQLMEDSMSGFLGMVDKTDDALFASSYWELKGKTLFHGMDELYWMIRDIKKEEPALCPICQRVLRLRPISPEETLRKRADGKDWGGASPVPPSPPPKQARFVA